MSESSTIELTHLQLGHPAEKRQDVVAREEPLEIRVEGRSVAVVMRTPGHDEELVAGFLVTEGVITCARDVLEISQCPSVGNKHGNIVDVLLGRAVVNWESLTRHVFSASSCGLCGKTSIESVFQKFPTLNQNQCSVRSPQPSDEGAGSLPTENCALNTEHSSSSLTPSSFPPISPDLIASLPAKLRAAQETFSKTGGLHASALFDAQGELIVIREDVGRHNALDKVLGYALQRNLLPLSQHILLVSGRVSFEIIQKALAGGIPIVAAISAPSSLAVDFAQDSGQTLIGFLRGETMNVYTHPERLHFPTPA
ncbi:FdhD protein [Prosthecobacter fusiformis]|uniref:Sulfur carrier protein FdhD n=1 Tax=Prosthecobacter fusiformis TaxID=48464 RepID=A0A4R7RL96_9BACT|nr:formate dehydrogenase accessory sulfurtransferase FdhD [Prosthecobacter fusiformis]TDU66042.1 FdhD protein [Prosthecobacter fusiformis]